MKFSEQKKNIEPFNLFGERSLIYSKQDAKKILIDNSYYFFIASAITFGIAAFAYFGIVDLGTSETTFIILSLAYLLLGIAIRRLQSRTASVIALIIFGWILILRIYESDIGGSFFYSFIFFAASWRSVKASFYFNKT